MSGFSFGDMPLELIDIIDVTKKYIRKEGFCYPALHVFNKAEPLGIEVQSDSIVAQTSNDDSVPLGEDMVYHTVIAFCLRDHADEEAIQTVANEIAGKYSPDAIACVLSCIYRGDEEIEKIVKETDPAKREMFRNSTGISVLHVCAFLPDTENFILKLIPYENYGKIKDNENPVPDLSDELKMEKLKKFIKDEIGSKKADNRSLRCDGPYSVGFTNSHWVNDNIDVEPKIRNPYLV